MKRLLIAIFALLLLLVGALASWNWLAPRGSTPAPRVALKSGDSTAPDKPTFEVKPPSRAATEREKQGAIRSIKAQLDAFRRDDYSSAARYQSQALRRNFSSTQAFQDVIENSYPQFANYKSVLFGSVTAQQLGDVVSINVPINLTGRDSVKVQATYNMVFEDGLYRVSGVSGGASRNAPSDSENQKPSVPPGFKNVAPLLT